MRARGHERVFAICVHCLLRPNTQHVMSSHCRANASPRNLHLRLSNVKRDHLMQHDFTVSSYSLCLSLFSSFWAFQKSVHLCSALSKWPTHMQTYAPYCFLTFVSYFIHFNLCLSDLVIPNNILSTLLCAVCSCCIIVVINDQVPTHTPVPIDALIEWFQQIENCCIL